MNERAPTSPARPSGQDWPLPACTVFAGIQTSDWSAGTARFFGINGHRTVLSQTRQDVRNGDLYTIVDVVSVKSNAEVWTRIGSDIAVQNATMVVAKKESNADWFDEVRRQGDLGLELLGTLKPSRP